MSSSEQSQFATHIESSATASRSKSGDSIAQPCACHLAFAGTGAQ